MNDVIKSGIIVGVIAILFFTPYLMSRGVSKLDNRTGFMDKILCAIPFLNLARAESIYYGHLGLMTVSPIVLIAGIGARVYLWLNMYDNVIANMASIIIFYGVILFYFICNMVFVYTVLHDSGVVEGWKLFLLAIAFPFGQYYIGNILTNAIRDMKSKEDTFKG